MSKHLAWPESFDRKLQMYTDHFRHIDGGLRLQMSVPEDVARFNPNAILPGEWDDALGGGVYIGVSGDGQRERFQAGLG